ncbi:MAG: TRAP transporter small permease [Myxococcota bacterium]|jgi:TRAP-type C4-dicarboxylate transport system permease small subunit|nr:TRAP transporter small permease [Myxococcota bacterium]
MSAGPGEKEAGGILRVLYRLEDVFLALLLGAMVVLAPLQIFLRNFFDAGIVWIDPLLRVLVLWVGLMGAVAASRSDRHIRIDAASKLLSPRAAAVLGILTGSFTAAVAGIVSWNSGRFVADEREFGSTAFSDIPAWMFEIVIPVAFGLIALRYGLRALGQVKSLLTGDLGAGSGGSGVASGSAS